MRDRDWLLREAQRYELNQRLLQQSRVDDLMQAEVARRAIESCWPTLLSEAEERAEAMRNAMGESSAVRLALEVYERDRVMREALGAGDRDLVAAGVIPPGPEAFAAASGALEQFERARAALGIDDLSGIRRMVEAETSQIARLLGSDGAPDWTIIGAAERHLLDAPWLALGAAVGLDAAAFDRMGESFTGLLSAYNVLGMDSLRLPSPLREAPRWEVSTSASLIDSLVRPAPEVPSTAIRTFDDLDDPGALALESMLAEVDAGFIGMWRGARDAHRSSRADRQRHVAASLRELHDNVLRALAPDGAVVAWTSDPKHYHKGRLTRGARVEFICREVDNGPFSEFLKAAVRDILAVLRLCQPGTHNPVGPFSELQLELLLVRAHANLSLILRIARSDP